MVKTDLKKIMCRMETCICVVMVIICLFVGVWDDLSYYFKSENTYYEPNFIFYYNSIFTGIINTILPAICVIPITLSLWDENNTGYGNMVLIRSKKYEFITSKIITAIFSGLYIVIFGSAIFVLILRMMGIRNVEDINNSIRGMDTKTIYYQWAQDGKGLLCIVLVIFCFSLTTIPWTMIVLVAAQYVRNKYLLIAIPILIDKVMVYVGYSYSDKLFLINPATWNVVTNIMVTTKLGGLVYVSIVMFIVVVTCSLAYVFLFRRRLKNG